MTTAMLVDRRLGDIWQILSVWREISPHLNTVLDDTKPWRDRIECGLHIVQIAAKLTPTTVDDDILAWLDETDIDDKVIDLIADFIEKMREKSPIPIVVGAEPVGGIPIQVIFQIAVLLFNLFFGDE